MSTENENVAVVNGVQPTVRKVVTRWSYDTQGVTLSRMWPTGHSASYTLSFSTLRHSLPPALVAYEALQGAMVSIERRAANGKHPKLDANNMMELFDAEFSQEVSTIFETRGKRLSKAEIEAERVRKEIAEKDALITAAVKLAEEKERQIQQLLVMLQKAEVDTSCLPEFAGVN